MPAPNLQTLRLNLRPFTTADLSAVHSLWTEPAVREYLWDGEEISVERAHESLQASEADFRDRGFGLWGLYLHEQSALVGFCGLRQAELTNDPELLFALQQVHWGSGFAYEAAHAVLTYAFDQLRLGAVEAATDTTNERSVRLLERLGMARVRQATVGDINMFFFRGVP